MNNIPEEITNYADLIDSRDVQDRINWLESEDATNTFEWQDKEIEEFGEELEKLNQLKSQYVDYFGERSWEFGAQFIRDSYFENYAQELAEDCGMINEGMQWPNNCIDWERAARELSMDYTEIDFDGVVYQTREA